MAEAFAMQSASLFKILAHSELTVGQQHRPSNCNRQWYRSGGLVIDVPEWSDATINGTTFGSGGGMAYAG